MDKKFSPSDFQAEAQQLLAAGKMPSIEQILKTVDEAREKYRDKILKSRKTKNIDAGADALGLPHESNRQGGR